MRVALLSRRVGRPSSVSFSAHVPLSLRAPSTLPRVVLPASCRRPRPDAQLATVPAAATRLRWLSSSASSSSSTAAATATKEKNYLGAALFGSLVVGTFGLGTWQASRYFWKEELIAERTRLLAGEPADLVALLSDQAAAAGTPAADATTHSPADAPTLHHTRVVIRGTFDHAKEILIGPRVPPKQDHGGGMNIAEVGGESSGVFVVTPLVLDDGRRVLVQRGWIPDPKRTKFRDEPALRFTVGPVNVVGVVQPPETERAFSPPNDVAQRRFLWFDPAAAAVAAGVDDLAPGALPLIVHATERSNPGRFPVMKGLDEYKTFHVGTETHAMYAGTWFTLSACGAVMTWMRFLR